MKGKIIIFAATLALMTPIGANAQINLNKLKDKAKETVKDKAKETAGQTTGSNKKPMSLAEEHALQDKARMEARMAALNADQKWAVGQLEDFEDAPELPHMINPEPNPLIGRGGQLENLEELVEILGSIDYDNVVRARAKIDSRLAYNKRVIELADGLPDGLSAYDPDYKLRPNLKKLQAQIEYFAELQRIIERDLMIYFNELKTTTDANGNITVAKGAWLSSKGGHGVAKDPSDGKFKFASYPAGFTFVDNAELKKQDAYLKWLKNAAALLANSEVSQNSKNFAKCDLACTMVEQAIANNSKENIKYVNRPAGSKMNTAQLRAEALKTLQKRFPTSGYSEVIITGDHWVEVKNVLGIVIERYIEVAAIRDGGIAKQIMYLSVGNDRTTTGWGSMHLYGVTGAGGYVK